VAARREPSDATLESGTIDTLRLDAAVTYDLSGLTTISNIDATAFSGKLRSS